MGLVYLIHFAKPLKHAKHYLGWCEDGNLQKRLKRHRAGTGSKLMQAIKQAGIKWDVVRTWENVDRNFERALKNRKNTSCFCPICRGSSPVLDLKLPQVAESNKIPF